MSAAGKGIALVTGASSGIGLAMAECLAERGHGLVLVARRADLLADHARRVGEAHDIAVEVLAADLAEAADLARVEARIDRGDIATLVNNAGIGGHGGFLETGGDAHDRMIAVNVTALTRLAHAACARMVERGGGTLINVASGFAFDFMPGAAVYAASKAYVFQLSQVIAAELGHKGIACQCLVPGLTRTNLGGAEESGLLDQFPPEMLQSPRAVAEASMAALDMGELVCLPKVEDHAAFTAAHEAWRAFGREPGHNEVASRYGVDIV